MGHIQIIQLESVLLSKAGSYSSCTLSARLSDSSADQSICSNGQVSIANTLFSVKVTDLSLPFATHKHQSHSSYSVHPGRAERLVELSYFVADVL
jgi:hypothetical protein